MNTERLYELLSQLEIETAKLDLLGKLDRLVEYVGQQVSDPSNAEHQTNFSSSRKELEASLKESWFSQLTSFGGRRSQFHGAGLLGRSKTPSPFEANNARRRYAARCS